MTCACKALDAYDCARYRYGDSFGEDASDQVEPCLCPCHDEEGDEGEELYERQEAAANLDLR